MDLFNKKIREEKKVLSKIIEQNTYRVRESISSWREALQLAEIKGKDYTPDRKPLLRVYKDIILDAHLQSVIDLRKEKVLAYNFNILYKNKVNDDMSATINNKWFYKLLEHIIDSFFYGHSLIQIDGIVDSNVSDITLIDRLNVIPETQSIQPNINSNTTFKYNEKPYISWLFEICKDKYDLGLLKSIAPLVLWKKSALSAWAEYTEVFGMPIRIAKTTSNVAEDRKRLFDFVKNLGKSAYAVIDSQETIEFIENKKTDSFNVYDKLIDLINKEISKLILGVTMLNDNGSSRSQSEVHSEQSEIRTKSDLRNIEFIINKEVLPKLIELGLFKYGVKFEFDTNITLGIDEQIKIDVELNKMYPLDKSYLTDKYKVVFADTNLNDLTK